LKNKDVNFIDCLAQVTSAQAHPSDLRQKKINIKEAKIQWQIPGIMNANLKPFYSEEYFIFARYFQFKIIKSIIKNT
jgi:hypothetical protein